MQENVYKDSRIPGHYFFLSFGSVVVAAQENMQEGCYGRSPPVISSAKGL